jgi:hypothetical protein
MTMHRLIIRPLNKVARTFKMSFLLLPRAVVHAATWMAKTWRSLTQTNCAVSSMYEYRKYEGQHLEVGALPTSDRGLLRASDRGFKIPDSRFPPRPSLYPLMFRVVAGAAGLIAGSQPFPFGKKINIASITSTVVTSSTVWVSPI